MTAIPRREFLRLAAAIGLWPALPSGPALARRRGATCNMTSNMAGPGQGMRLGMVTYLWGKDWDLPTLLANCERARIRGIELRTSHAHGVEPELDAAARREVRDRLADSPITLVGLGSDERFDSPDPQVVRRAIERTCAFLKLSHDVGGTGVKVKPNDFHEGIEHQVTIEQIGRALNKLGPIADDLDQQIRLEVHGSCCHLPDIARIMEVATHPRVAVCWNSNSEDLAGEGIEKNFGLIAGRLGDTVHIRELDVGNYPYAKLFALLAARAYSGWVLLEARTAPADRVAAMTHQRELFCAMLAAAHRPSERHGNR